MVTRGRRVRQLEYCDRAMFGDMIITCQSLPAVPIIRQIHPLKILHPRLRAKSEGLPKKDSEQDKRRASLLVDLLLVDIYSNVHNCSDYNSATSSRSQRTFTVEKFELLDKSKFVLILLLKLEILSEHNFNEIEEIKIKNCFKYKAFSVLFTNDLVTEYVITLVLINLHSVELVELL